MKAIIVGISCKWWLVRNQTRLLSLEGLRNQVGRNPLVPGNGMESLDLVVIFHQVLIVELLTTLFLQRGMDQWTSSSWLGFWLVPMATLLLPPILYPTNPSTCQLKSHQALRVALRRSSWESYLSMKRGSCRIKVVCHWQGDRADANWSSPFCIGHSRHDLQSCRKDVMAMGNDCKEISGTQTMPAVPP